MKAIERSFQRTVVIGLVAFSIPSCYASLRPSRISASSKLVGDGTALHRVHDTAPTSDSNIFIEDDVDELVYQFYATHSDFLSPQLIATQPEMEDDVFTIQPPTVHVDNMIDALKWTADVNSRLEKGTMMHHHGTQISSETVENQLRGGGGTAVAYRIPFKVVSKSRSIEAGRASQSALFYSEKIKGPDLAIFLREVLGDVICDDDEAMSSSEDEALERTLAMIYLDRACSVETSRRSNDAQRLPFCTQQTVHRLALTAVLLAVSAVRGDSSLDVIYDRVHERFGLSPNLCQTMVDRMRAALGDSGIYVTPDELLHWKYQWQTRFPS